MVVVSDRALADDAQSLAGKKLGRYKLKRVIGRGAMGDVYEATSNDGVKVAVKVLTARSNSNAQALARFEREAAAVQRLQHPNIVKVVEVGSSRSRPFIAMELLRGAVFTRMLRSGEKPVEVVTALAELARALEHAHKEGIIHRDIKPDNVLMDKRGCAKIGDFGLARAVDDTTLTAEGAVMGTVRYMSPEQAHGQRAGPPSDVYSVGVMIYEAISGAVPFSSEAPTAMMYKHAFEVVPKPLIRDGFNPVLGKLALSCLAKTPEARPTMGDVALALEEASLWKKRRRPWRSMSAALLLVALGGLAWMVFEPSVFETLCTRWDPACTLDSWATHLRAWL